MSSNIEVLEPRECAKCYVQAFLLPRNYTLERLVKRLLRKATQLHIEEINYLISCQRNGWKCTWNINLTEQRLSSSIERRGLPFKISLVFCIYRLTDKIYKVEVCDSHDLLGEGLTLYVKCSDTSTKEHLLNTQILSRIENELRETCKEDVKLIVEGTQEFELLQSIFDFVLADFYGYEQFYRTVQVRV